MLNRRAWLRTYGSAAICGSVGAANVFFASSGRIAAAGPWPGICSSAGTTSPASWSTWRKIFRRTSTDWRPAPGVRSFAEQLLHAAGFRDVCRRERERPPSGRGGSCACELQVQGGDRGLRETRLCRWRKVDCRPERRATAIESRRRPSQPSTGFALWPVGYGRGTFGRALWTARRVLPIEQPRATRVASEEVACHWPRGRSLRGSPRVY